MSRLRAFPLDGLEVASGVVLGRGRGDPARPIDATDPVTAFEQPILAGLLRPPCLVSFSGGRDSSAVLAVAARIARREGLPLPIPATNRFPSVAASDERSWQELVVAHLGLTDWFCNEVRDELDCVGPVAAGVLRRHGLLWPFNAFFHVPLLEAARGGSLLTGVGGDELLGGTRWARADAVLSRRVRPRLRDVPRVGVALAPRPVRRLVLRRRLDVRFPWLTDDASRRLRAAWAAQDAAEPRGWGRDFAWWRGLRSWQVAERSLAVLAEDSDVRIAHPFATPELAASLARLPRERRFGDRSAAMAMMFGGDVPPAVAGRADKASFDGAFFTTHSRRLVEAWAGEGADPRLVDVPVLRGVWRGEEPDARSFLQLQSAWLATEPSAHSSEGYEITRKELVPGTAR